MKQKKILVVDDNADNRDIITQMLEDLAEVIEANSGLKAVELLVDNKLNVNLVLLDIIMPDLDGYETLKILKAKNVNLPPVVALTALTSAKEIERAKTAGFNGFIGKPFVYANFYKQVEDILNNKI